MIHILQAAFSAYNLYLSSIAIRKLLGYEEKAKKAAKWSDIAEKELYKTRTTQASNAIAVSPFPNTPSHFLFLSFSSNSCSISLNQNQILLTFLSSTAMLLLSTKTSLKLGLPILNIAVLSAARAHVGEFWAGKAKIPMPGVGDYNDAITITQITRLNALYLIFSWVAVGMLEFIF